MKMRRNKIMKKEILSSQLRDYNHQTTPQFSKKNNKFVFHVIKYKRKVMI